MHETHSVRRGCRSALPALGKGGDGVHQGVDGWIYPPCGVPDDLPNEIMAWLQQAGVARVQEDDFAWVDWDRDVLEGVYVGGMRDA